MIRHPSLALFHFSLLTPFLLPFTQLGGERLIDLSHPGFVGVIPKTVMAMPIVDPTGVIQYGVKTEALNRDAVANGGFAFLADITKPGGPRFVFSAGLGDIDGAMVPFVNLSEHFAKGTIKRMVAG